MEVVVLIVALAATGLLVGWRARRRGRAARRFRPGANDGIGRRASAGHDRFADLTTALAEAEAGVDRLARADRERAAFLTGLSHALRSHLNGVCGLAQAVRLNEGAEPLTRRQAQAVEGILAAAASLKALTEAVQDFIHLDEMTVTRVDPQLAIRDVCLELTAEAAARRVDLRCPAPTAGIGVMADAGRLRRILRCLVANAIAFNRPDGAVLIEVRQTAEGVTLFVHDTGCGLPPDRLPALFQPFAHGIGQNRGHSLSLAGAHALAEAMGGRLRVASQPGQGSTFSLHLPAATRSEPRSVEAPPVRLPSATLVHVDATASGALVMKHALSALGAVALYPAPSGAEGLALARSLRPDVVLVDVDLPDMDGYELKLRLDADGLTRDIPVIALSAAALPGDLRRVRAAGFAACLTKPLDLIALAETLRTVLGDGPRGRAERSAAA